MKRLLYSLKRERNGERNERVKAGEAERPLEKRKKKKNQTILYFCRSKGGTKECDCKDTTQNILICALAQRHSTVSKIPTSPLTIKT